jgi:hypothetical protein
MNRNDLTARADAHGLTVEATTKNPRSHVVTLTGPRATFDALGLPGLAEVCGYTPTRHYGYRVHRDQHGHHAPPGHARATVMLYTD